MWFKKQIKEFFLGAPPPPRPAPIQKDIGKIVVTIHFQNGTIVEKVFFGENNGWRRLVGSDDWFPYTNNAHFVYNDWLDNLTVVKGENVDIPFHQIVKIVKVYTEHIVTVS